MTHTSHPRLSRLEAADAGAPPVIVLTKHTGETADEAWRPQHGDAGHPKARLVVVVNKPSKEAR